MKSHLRLNRMSRHTLAKHGLRRVKAGNVDQFQAAAARRVQGGAA